MNLARAALCVAIAIRDGAAAAVLFRTDRGGEYIGNVFVEACRSAGVTQSMGGTEVVDNAVAEAFISTLEFELLSRRHFLTCDQARRAVAAFIDEYNTDIPPTTCPARSPTNAPAPLRVDCCGPRTLVHQGNTT
jgi:transposase InsO family protein